MAYDGGYCESVFLQHGFDYLLSRHDPAYAVRVRPNASRCSAKSRSVALSWRTGVR
ncbi:hypothetical protein OG568_09460 [Streptomyces sp. NBC_01450]|uniref:hypothetical protein n=1 Tax=Streptomyces sp. NBC_01450 TaxID=2903871 RepID=UPI002E36D48F|nr:hypothetical protein [Streptomyces sp. NBC_01450]